MFFTAIPDLSFVLMPPLMFFHNRSAGWLKPWFFKEQSSFREANKNLI
jgi:hypothetical protein